ncbi:MAG: SGNH/GDSL hydrolase family protein [bacterium]
MKSFQWLKTSILLGAMTLAVCVFGAEPVKIGTDLSKVLPDALTLAANAPQEKVELLVKAGDKLAFMGDSITAQGGYVRLAQYVLNTNYPDLKPVIINTGVSGQKAENMEPRFEKDMKLAEKPAFTFISVGINDVWHRVGAPHQQAVLDTYKANVAKMVDKGQAAGAQVVLLTPTIIQEDVKNEGNIRLDMYVAAMKDIAAEKKCKIIDLHAMFINALNTKPAGLRLTADGVHMNPYGDAMMAIGVLRALGVSDEIIGKTDPIGAFQIKGMGPIGKVSELLEVPPTRFYKPGLSQLLSF